MKLIRVHDHGGLDALRLETAPTPTPADDEALVRLEAIGVNFIDVYHRTGLYPLPLPFTPGSEGAGVVESIGRSVRDVKPGDRVAYAMVRGSYAEYHAVLADRLVPIPEGIDSRTAAASILQGMTAHYLAASTYPIREGDNAIVHAAAGGVGGLLVQMAKSRAARVFATASTGKLQLPRSDGADFVIDYTNEDFEQVVNENTNGRGVEVVYDSVGRTTFDKSLNCVATRGVLALFGQSSGPVQAFDPGRLAKRGIYLTRPSLAHYTRTREELLWRAREVFNGIRSGWLRPRIDRELPLSEASEGHRLLESRQTTGKLVLIP